MMRLIHSLLAVVAVQNICFADVTKLPADDQKALRDVSRFHEIHAATNLPPAVFAFCADRSGRLAEPGQKWEVSDVITDPKLPQKRMIWAVTDGSYYVVHYESGGYAHNFHVLVARLEDDHSKPSLVWHGVCFGPLKDFRAFVDALTSKKLDDRNDYIEGSIRSLHATLDGARSACPESFRSSASRFTSFGPVCLSWTLGIISPQT